MTPEPHGEQPLWDKSDEPPVATYEGWFSRLFCSACQDMFEIEDDVQNGQEVVCDSCGVTLVVERTT